MNERGETGMAMLLAAAGIREFGDCISERDSKLMFLIEFVLQLGC